MTNDLTRKIDENAHQHYILKCNISSYEDDLKKAQENGDSYGEEIAKARIAVAEEQLREAADYGNLLILKEQEAAGYWGC